MNTHLLLHVNDLGATLESLTFATRILYWTLGSKHTSRCVRVETYRGVFAFVNPETDSVCVGVRFRPSTDSHTLYLVLLLNRSRAYTELSLHEVVDVCLGTPQVQDWLCEESPDHVPADDLPWEIHLIADPVARKAATAAYRAGMLT